MKIMLSQNSQSRTPKPLPSPKAVVRAGPKPPIKPDSPFSSFIVNTQGMLMKKGLNLEEAQEKAVKMWRVRGLAVKDKYEYQYKKRKEKYDADMIKYEQKLKKLEESAEKKKGEIFFVPI